MRRCGEGDEILLDRCVSAAVGLLDTVEAMHETLDAAEQKVLAEEAVARGARTAGSALVATRACAAAERGDELLVHRGSAASARLLDASEAVDEALDAGEECLRSREVALMDIATRQSVVTPMCPLRRHCMAAGKSFTESML